MLVVFAFPSVSCEAPRALEIAEGQIVRNSQVFNVERAAAPGKIRGCSRTGAAYIDTPVVWAAGSWRITCAAWDCQLFRQNDFEEL